MIDVAWIKLLLSALALVGAVRLLVVLFVGDYHNGPAIGRIKQVGAANRQKRPAPPKSVRG